MHYLKKELYALLKEDEQIFSFLQDEALDGLWYWDLEKPENEWMNERFWNVLGYNPDEMPHLASAWQGIVNQEDLKTALDNFHEHLENPEHPYDLNVRYTHKNGSTVWIRCRGVAIRDESGKPVRMLGTHQNITGIKQAEEKLQESESLFRTLFEQSAMGMARVAPDGRFLQVNRKFGAIIGYAAEELLSMNFAQITHPDDLHLDDHYIQKVLNNEIDEFTIEKRYLHKDKRIVWIKLCSNVVRNDKGDVLYAIASITDITERRKAQAATIQSESRYKNLIETASDAIYMMDDAGRIIDTNQMAEQMLQKSREEIVGSKIDTVDPNFPVKDFIDFWKNTPFEEQRIFETTHVNKEGQHIPVEVSGKKFKIEDTIYYYGIARDLRERKKADSQLHMLTKTVEHSLNAFDIVNHKGKFIYVNQAYVEMAGYESAEEIIGTSPVAHCVDPDTPKHVIAMLKKYGKYIFEHRAKRKDGSEYDVLMYARLDYDENGNEIYPTTSLNVTQQKTLERQLRENEEKYRKISGYSTDYSYAHAFDEAGRISLEWHFGAFKEITGYDPEKMVEPDQISKLIHPDDLPEAGKRTERLLNGETVISDLRIITKSGEVKWIRDKGVPEWNEERTRVVRSIGIAREITEIKKAEEKIRESEEKFRRLYANSPFGIVICRMIRNKKGKAIDFIHLEGNDASAENTGFNLSDLVGKKASELVDKKSRAALTEKYSRVVETGETLNYSEHFDLYGKTLQVTVFPLHGDTFILNFIDITQKVAAENEIKAHVAFLNSTMEHSPFSMWICDASGTVVKTNKVLREKLKLEEDQIVKTYNVLKDENLAQQGKMDQVEKVFTDLIPARFEMLWSGPKTGLDSFSEASELWIDVSLFPVQDAAGTVKNVVCQWVDISERKKSENEIRSANQQLHASEAQLKKHTHDLEKRFKELNCVFQVSEIVRTENDVDKMYQRIANLLPQAWQYPEIAAGRVQFDDLEFVSRKFKETQWRLSADIMVNDTVRGKVDVFYLEARPEMDGGPFLREERELINALGRICSDAIERKQAEEALKKSEVKFRSYIENAPDGVFITDEKGNYLEVNSAACSITGYSDKELLERSIPDLLQKDEIEKGLKHFQEVQKKGSARGVIGFVTKSGENRYWEVAAVKLTDTRLLGFVKDITEQKKAEALLELSERRMNTLMNNLSGMAYRCLNIPKWTMLFVSSGCEALTGYNQQELVQDMTVSYQEIIHPEDREYVWATIQSVVSQEALFELEYRIINKSGEERWVWERGVCAGNDDKGHQILEGFITDITERKQAEENLRISDQRYRRAQEMGHVANWEYNLQTTHFWGSDEARRIYGFDTNASDFTTEEVENCIPDRERVHQALIDLIEHDKPYHLEFDILTRHTKERKTIVSIAELERDNEGNPFKVTGVIQDITDLMQAQEALRKSEEKLNLVIATSPIGICTVDEKGDFITTNSAYEEMIGYSKEECRNLSFFDVTHPDDRPENKKMFQSMFTLEASGFSMEKRYVRKNGDKIDVSVNAIGIADAKGRVRFGTAFVEDITERKRQESILKAKSEISLILQSKDEDELYAGVLDVVLQVTESRHGIFGYIDEAGALVCPSMTKEIGHECRMMDKTVVFPKETWGDSIWGNGLRNRKSAYSNQPFKVPEGHLPVERFLTVPLVDQDESIGLISVGNKQSDYSDEDLRLLQDIADYLTPVIVSRLQRARFLKVLKESEEKFRRLYENSPFGIIINRLIKDDQGKPVNFIHVQANPSAGVHLGMNLEDLLGKKATEIADEETAGKFIHLYGEVVRTGNPYYGEQYFSHHNRTLLVSAFHLTGDLFITNFIDITERKQTEMEKQQALKEARERTAELTALLEGANYVLSRDDFEKTARNIFDAACRMTGAQSGYVALLSEDGEENEVLFLESGGMPCDVNPELPMPIRGLRAEAYKSGHAVFDNNFMQSEWMKFMPEGHVVLHNVLFAPLNVEGKTLGIMGLANKPEDFNEADRRMAEAFGDLAAMALRNTRSLNALQDRNEFIETIMENLPIGLAVNTMDDGNIKYINKPFEEIYGWPKETLPNVSAFFENVFPDPEIRQKIQDKILRDMQSGDPERMRWDDLKISTSQGEERFVYAYNIPMPEKNQMISTVQDRTERKKAEMELQEKMDHLKRLNRVMTGREDRMIELKQQVNRLSERCGEKAPYNLDFLKKKA